MWFSSCLTLQRILPISAFPKIIGYAPNRERERGIPSASPALPEVCGGIPLHASLLPVPSPWLLYYLCLRRSTLQITDKYSPPWGTCSTSRSGGCYPGWRGPSEPVLLCSIPPFVPPSSWPDSWRWRSCDAKVSPALAEAPPGCWACPGPSQPPRSLSSKAPRLVKPLLCAPLM